MNRAAHALRAEREFWSETVPAMLEEAKLVQTRVDDSLGLRIPVGDATESDWGDLMPMERALFPQFADTQAPGTP